MVIKSNRPILGLFTMKKTELDKSVAKQFDEQTNKDDDGVMKALFDSSKQKKPE